MLRLNYKPQFLNKRTALKRNLEAFKLQQQIEIIKFLSELPKFKDNEALDKYSKGIFQRNVLDDIKLSLELLLNIY